LGELQAAYGPESTLHSKLDPGCEEVKLKAGVGSLLVPVGPPPIVVSGETVSTVNVRDAGVGS
jgi:hypothetical protein